MPGLICLREKLWARTYSIGDQVPTCPRSGIKVNLSRHNIYIYIYMNAHYCATEVENGRIWQLKTKSKPVVVGALGWLKKTTWRG